MSQDVRPETPEPPSPTSVTTPAPSVRRRLPRRTPGREGVKPTVTSHRAPGASVLVQALPSTEKSSVPDLTAAVDGPEGAAPWLTTVTRAEVAATAGWADGHLMLRAVTCRRPWSGSPMRISPKTAGPL